MKLNAIGLMKKADVCGATFNFLQILGKKYNFR
jgi:hypothetical protein